MLGEMDSKQRGGRAIPQVERQVFAPSPAYDTLQLDPAPFMRR